MISLDNRIRKFLRTSNLAGTLTRVSFMLSNICNYAYMHKACPASMVSEREILSLYIIEDLLGQLKELGFSGVVAFHIYNEPMAYPRLFYIISRLKQLLPHTVALVYSNGFNLTDMMVDELQDIGCNVLVTTGYGDDEYLRLSKLNPSIAYRVVYGRLDSRLTFYSPDSPAKECDHTCRAFNYELCIYSNGDVGLCCLDYEHRYELGNVYRQSIGAILNSERVLEFQRNILTNLRTYSICKKCGWHR